MNMDKLIEHIKYIYENINIPNKLPLNENNNYFSIEKNGDYYSISSNYDESKNIIIDIIGKDENDVFRLLKSVNNIHELEAFFADNNNSDEYIDEIFEEDDTFE